MKNALFAMIAMATATTAQANYKTIEVSSSGSIRAEAHLSLKSELGKRLFDALSKTAVLKEEKSMYAAPGTTYRSDSGNVLVRKDEALGTVELFLNLEAGEADVQMGGRALRIAFTKRDSAAGVLHQALLASESDQVLTAKNPGKVVRPHGDQAVVLSTDVFSGDNIGCSTPVASTRSYCDLQIAEKQH